MIRANDAKAKILAKHEDAIKQAERVIDDRILACEEPSGPVKVVIYEALHAVVCARIREMYDAGDWLVTHAVHNAQDQRDDTYTTFTLEPKVERARESWPHCACGALVRADNGRQCHACIVASVPA